MLKVIFSERRWLLTTLLTILFISPALNAETILVTGANRGIGLEFTKQYAERGWHVIATHRRNSIPDTLAELTAKYDNVQVETMDVSSPEQISALAKKLEGVPIDVLLNNAAIMGINSTGTLATQTNENFGSLVVEDFMPYFTVNVLGPLLVWEAFEDHVLTSDRKMFLAMTSGAGSVTLPTEFFPGTGFFYKGSKAALNRSMVNLAAHMKSVDPEALVFNIAPGFTITERFEGMTADEMGNRGTPVAEVVAGFQKVIDDATPEYSGKIWEFTGKQRPY